MPRLAGLPGATRDAELARVLDLVGLTGRERDRTGGFSKGMQQRLGLATALLGDPDLVILDEPTSALDPVGRDDVRAIIREAATRGSTVLLNSHLLGEVERLCDRVAIVNRGRVVAAGSLDDLLGATSVRLRVTDLADPATRRSAPSARSRPTATGWSSSGVDPDRVPDLVAAAVAAGGRIHAVDPGRRSLEDLFLDLVRDASGPASRRTRRMSPRQVRRHRRPHAARVRPAADRVGAARPLGRERAARRLGRRPAGRRRPRRGHRASPRSRSASARS